MEMKTIELYKVYKEFENQLKKLEKKEVLNIKLSIEKLHEIFSNFIDETREKVPKEALPTIEFCITGSKDSNAFEIESIDYKHFLIEIRIPKLLEKEFSEKKINIIAFYNRLNRILLSELVNTVKLLNKDWEILLREIPDKEIQEFVLGISTIAILQYFTYIPKNLARIKIKNEKIILTSMKSSQNIEEISTPILKELSKKLDINGEYEPPLDLFELIDLIFEDYLVEFLSKFIDYFKPYVSKKTIIELDIPRLIEKELSNSYDLEYIANVDTYEHFRVINLLLKAAYLVKSIKINSTALRILGEENILRYEHELGDGRYNPTYNPEDFDVNSSFSRKSPRVGFSLYYPGSEELVFQIKLINTELNIEEIIRQLENFKTETNKIIKALQKLLNQPFPKNEDPVQLKYNILNLHKSIRDKWFNLKKKISYTAT